MASPRACIFVGNLTLRNEVYPAIDRAWKARFGQKPKYGDLVRIWKARHCRVLAPGGSDLCPYSRAQCTEAFRQAVMAVIEAPNVTSPNGYFIGVAKSSAIQRAEDKPLSREGYDRGSQHRDEPGQPVHPGLSGRRGDQPGQSGTVVLDSSDLRGPVHRGPQRIGELLGAYDLGPREGPAKDGKASAK